MADIVSEIVLDGGGPWGFRLQGGKDFGIPLNVSRVTPGSKAALKQMVVGDIICEINGFNMESLSHMEAQNHIKNAGSTLNMKIRKGKGISVGDQNAMSFGSAGSPKVLTETNVIHSASVDHTFNPKPKPFNFGTNSPTVTQGVSPQKSSPAPPAQAPKFDPGAYARKKKEELEQRKKAESTVAEDSDILKMINATSISKSPSPTSHSQTEEGSDPGAFRMVYSGRDIHEEVSPGSKSVISSLKDRVSQENSGLNSESKVPSRVFQMLQKQLDEEQAEASSSPQDFIDALKQRLRSEATNENQNNGQTCSRQDDSSHQAISPSTSSHFTSTQIPQPPPTPLIPSYQTRPPAKTNASYLQMPLTHVNQVNKEIKMSEVVNTNKLPRRISYPRLRAESKNRNITMSVPSKDAPPINKDHVFKMSYETRDIHAADISMGSMNVMNSLKEKLALKSATGSNYEVATKTPSRVHAMLNEQLGYEEEEREERFHSDQTRTVPSKVFQALQYAYPSSEDNAPGAQKEKRYQENSLKQEDEEEYVRFRSSQTNTVPSKVFKALQYSYPTKSAAPLDPVYQQMQEERSGHQPYRTDQRQYKDAYEEEDGYGRFVGNPTNKVPSKVFQALQYSYDTPQTIETNSDTNVVHNVDPGYLKYSNHVPSKSFQRLQKQYNDEKEKRSEAIPGDLQDAIDLLEKELDAMTSSKTNPVIMVPLNRGLNRGQRPSEELSPVCPAENPAVQVPLHAHSTKDGPLARNNQQLNQAISFAPPVPVRIDSKRFQHQPRMSTGEDVVYQAPVAKVQGLPQRPANQHRSTSNSQDDEVIQAPVAHLENVVAYSAEFETPWIMPSKAKGSSSLSITHKSAAVRRNKDQRADSLDSSSSYSSIQERIPDFDPDTYVLTTKPPSVSSHGIRSDSSESAHSHSSRSSIGQENRFGEETPAAITHLSSHVSKSSNGNFGSEIAKPRRMVININGKARVSSASKHEEGTDQGIAVLSTGIRDQGLMQLDNSDTNYHENSASINHSGHSEENSIQNDVFVDPVPTINKSGKSIPLQSGKVDPHAENQVETSTLTDLQLTEINSEQLTEMYVENEETSSMCDYFQRLEEEQHIPRKIEFKSGNLDDEPTPSNAVPGKILPNNIVLRNTMPSNSVPSNIGQSNSVCTNSESRNKDTDPSRKPAVYVQSRKPQQHQLICMGPVAGRSNSANIAHGMNAPTSPPVNVQMSRIGNRRSIPLDSLLRSASFNFDHLNMHSEDCMERKGQRSPAANRKRLNPKMFREKDCGKPASVSHRPKSVKDETLIVANEISNEEKEKSEGRLKRAFDIINATADRILDQIDKVGSFNEDDYYLDEGAVEGDNKKEQSDVFINETDEEKYLKQKEDGSYEGECVDENRNVCDLNGFSGNSQNGRKHRHASSERPSGKELYYTSNHLLTSPKTKPSGVRVTLPAFTVKVSSGVTPNQGMQPPRSRN